MDEIEDKQPFENEPIEEDADGNQLEETLPIDFERLGATVRRIHADTQTSVKKIKTSAPGDEPSEDEYRILIPLAEKMRRYNITRADAILSATRQLYYRKAVWVTQWIEHMGKYGWPSRLG